MAQPQDDEQLSSFMPDPPPFFKYFTTENIERLEEIKQQNAPVDPNDASSPHLTAQQVLDLPPELRYLIPPEPPAQDAEYRVFGEVTKIRGLDDFDHTIDFIKARLWDDNVNDGVLKDWEYEQLYPSSSPSSAFTSAERQIYLFRFVRSIMLSFVELLGILAANPESAEKDGKLRDIMTLVLNMHALVNEYRPHQARETLIGLMEGQLERKRKEVEGVKRMAAKVRETLEGFGRDAPKDREEAREGSAGSYDAEEVRRGNQRLMWQAMDEILGH